MDFKLARSSFSLVGRRKHDQNVTRQKEEKEQEEQEKEKRK